MLGLSRAAAARFSFLLSVPAISAAGLWQIIEFSGQSAPVPWGPLAVATLISGMTAFLAIAAFLRLIERVGMLVFAGYRVLLAGVILYAFM
jgi:undecaprenyl-diphosphatase